MKYNIIHKHLLESTNTTAAELAAGGAEEFTTVVADHQSNGKGRGEHSFFSQNGLYMSVVIRPADTAVNATLLTLYTACCVHRAIRKVCGFTAKIKWVNDIVTDEGKLCGILCESYFKPGSDKIDYVIDGIGINLGEQEFPEELKNVATSLVLPPQKLEKIKIKLCKKIIRYLSKYQSKIKDRSFMNYYREFCSVMDKRVMVSGDGEPYEAVVMGVDDDGGLMTISKKGAKILRYGEVSIKPENTLISE